MLIPTISSIDLVAQEGYPVNKFGIRVGGNANSWTNEFPALQLNGDFIFPDDWKATFGGHGGLYVNIRLSELVAIEPAVMLTQKGTGTILNAGGASLKPCKNPKYGD